MQSGVSAEAQNHQMAACHALWIRMLADLNQIKVNICPHLLITMAQRFTQFPSVVLGILLALGKRSGSIKLCCISQLGIMCQTETSLG